MTEQPVQHQVVYRADPHTVNAVMSVRHRIRQIGNQCMKRRVVVQTVDGHTYEGEVVHMDDRYLYLSVPRELYRQFFNPFGANYYNNVILPLVLYELLTITLLLT